LTARQQQSRVSLPRCVLASFVLPLAGSVLAHGMGARPVFCVCISGPRPWFLSLTPPLVLHLDHIPVGRPRCWETILVNPEHRSGLGLGHALIEAHIHIISVASSTSESHLHRAHSSLDTALSLHAPGPTPSPASQVSHALSIRPSPIIN
jgi:hypothetical protein